MTIEELKTSVTASVHNKTDDAIRRATAHLVDREIEERAKLIRESMELHNKLIEARQSIRAKSPGYDANMNALPPIYTAEQIKTLQRRDEQIKKLNNAFDLAVLDGNFSNFRKVVEEIGNAIKDVEKSKEEKE